MLVDKKRRNQQQARRFFQRTIGRTWVFLVSIVFPAFWAVERIIGLAGLRADLNFWLQEFQRLLGMLPDWLAAFSFGIFLTLCWQELKSRREVDRRARKSAEAEAKKEAALKLVQTLLEILNKGAWDRLYVERHHFSVQDYSQLSICRKELKKLKLAPQVRKDWPEEKKHYEALLPYLQHYGVKSAQEFAATES